MARFGAAFQAVMGVLMQTRIYVGVVDMYVAPTLLFREVLA